jgi:signal transduction histidine kinase
MPARDSRIAWAFLTAGVVAIGIYFLLPTGRNAQSDLYDAIGLTSALAIAAGVRLNRPNTPLPWLLFALGNLLFATADTILNALDNPPVPSAADPVYLAGYPVLAAGLVILLVRSGGHHRVAALGEAWIVTCAFALVQWVFLMSKIVHGPGTQLARGVLAAYPAADVVLLAGLAGFFVTAAWKTRSFELLVGSVVLLLAADEVYGTTTYYSGEWVDALWLLSYLLWATAALHPSMRELSRPRRTRRVRVSPGRIALLTCALLTAPAVLLVQWARGAPLEALAVVIASTAISISVVLRLTGIMRALEALRGQEQVARAEAETMQRLLREQNERLLESDRLKDEFVALISHDLRTPLTSIIGYVELVLDEHDLEPLDEERRSYLEIVSRSSDRLLRLVDDLLFVARLQAGQLALTPAFLDLAEIGAQSVREALPHAERKGITIAFDADGPVPVEADKGRIFQLLDNLITNAIKFTPEDGEVEVCARRAGEGGAVLEVSDTGIGLTPDEAARVFDRFFRSSQAVEGQIPGTGLGLFIANAIVEAHGGTIRAESRAGGGTTFRIDLPARVPAKELVG